MQVYMSIPGVSNAPRMSNIQSTHLKPVHSGTTIRRIHRIITFLMSHKRLAIINRRSCWVGKVYLIFALSVYLTVVQIIEKSDRWGASLQRFTKANVFPDGCIYHSLSWSPLFRTLDSNVYTSKPPFCYLPLCISWVVFIKILTYHSYLAEIYESHRTEDRQSRATERTAHGLLHVIGSSTTRHNADAYTSPAL